MLALTRLTCLDLSCLGTSPHLVWPHVIRWKKISLSLLASTACLHSNLQLMCGLPSLVCPALIQVVTPLFSLLDVLHVLSEVSCATTEKRSLRVTNILRPLWIGLIGSSLYTKLLFCSKSGRVLVLQDYGAFLGMQCHF